MQDRQQQTDEPTASPSISPSISSSFSSSTFSSQVSSHPVSSHTDSFADETAPVWAVWLRESLQIILPALLLALVVHLFLAQATVVFGQSMEPNLSAHQRLIIDKISYRLHPPQRYDIVVIDLPEMDEMLVKRIIGLPGETVELRGGAILINNKPAPEPFPHDLQFSDIAPRTLGPLEYFVLGDNRNNSNDSRAFGPIQRNYIVGRVWLRYWPLSQLKYFGSSGQHLGQ